MKRLSFLALVLSAVLGCSDSPVAQVESGLLSLTVISGDEQTGPVGQELSEPLVVRVTTTAANGKEIPVPNSLVNFVVTEGGGSVFAGAALTSPQGVAQDYWTLGPDPGQNVVEVRAVESDTGEKQLYGRFTAIGLMSKIAFSSHPSGIIGRDIYVMNADGTGRLALTNDPAIDDQPVWSPDGKKIAFNSRRSGNGDIYLINPDGSGLTQLTESASLDWGSSWSPDSKRIAFLNNDDIWVIGTDGLGLVQLTDLGNVRSLAWSPDGSRIAFSSDSEIYAMNPDGSGVEKLAEKYQSQEPTEQDYLEWPRWSPDGSRLAFMRLYSDPDGYFLLGEIDIVNPDGSGRRRVAGVGANPEDDFAWSPDGTKIAYQVIVPEGHWGIWVTNVDDPPPLYPTQLAGPGAFRPSWSPDGTQIAYSSGAEIYVMNADGSSQTNLTNTPDDAEGAPRWQPGT